MDAVEYLKAKYRMCDWNTRDVETCEGCPLLATENNCELLERESPDEAVHIVEDWLKRHPLRTRQSVFGRLREIAEKLKKEITEADHADER